MNTQTKLQKQGYKWARVSEMFEETPPCGSNCEIQKKYPGYEGLWCRLIMAVTSYAMTKNSVAVIHGPSNCAWAVRNFCQTNYALYYGNSFLQMPVTDINQHDVISGGIDKLINTLKEVDRDYKPEHICVFDSCSTALIGDDIETAIKTAQQSCNAKIDYISSAGFISPPLGKSIEETAAKYADMMEKPEEIIENTVNILGQYKEQQDSSHAGRQKRCKHKNRRGKYLDDASELSRLIEGIGLDIHRILISGAYDYIKTAPQAKVNIISCPTWGIPLAKRMEERFNTPYIEQCIPIGIEPTEKWIMELAKFTGKTKEAEFFIQKELQEIMPEFEKAKNMVNGKTALIECGRNSQTAFARPMALARALEELGMKIRLFGLHPLELKAKETDFNYFMQEGFDPLILNGNYAYQQPVNISHVVEDLELKQGEYVYFTQDVFPAARGGCFDPANIPRVETGVHLRRVVNAPGRGVGFKGAKALYKSVIEAVMFSERASKPTLYGRVHGDFYENI
ncbi:MAG TPA: nitrogenase component 1 [Candidatus Gastranaerophilales bacterium]|nr:nitrogenase component 1 [Candidatus Gastranaerophilales bacterium]